MPALAFATVVLSLTGDFASVRAGEVAPTTGRLVIIGGGLDPENRSIYETFLATSQGRVAVVPLASGVPEKSGPLTVQDIQAFAERPDRIFDSALRFDAPEIAATEATAELLGSCDAIWFTGGDQSRIIAALRPSGGDVPAYDAVLNVLRAGGTIGGTSAGAAMMSDRMIRSGNSEEALKRGVTEMIDGPGVCLGKGMGLFPYGLVDQHFLRRGRFGRLLVALEGTETAVGFGVSENRAMVVDLATGRFTTVGDQAVTVIDRRNADRKGGVRSNLRIHLLGGGDSMDGRTFEVSIDPEKRTYSGSDDVAPPFSGLWGRYVIRKMIEALANDPSTPVTGTDGGFVFELTADDTTQFWGAGAVSAVNVRLDIRPVGSDAAVDLDAAIQRGQDPD